MNRRDLIRCLLALPIAATVDVEHLLWVPKPIITVPYIPKFVPKYYEVSVPVYTEDILWMGMKISMTLYVPGQSQYAFGFSGFNEADRQQYCPDVPMAEIDAAIAETGQYPRVKRQ